MCAGAFAALFPACLPDGTSPELPISTAGAGGAFGPAAGSGPMLNGGSTAGRAGMAGTGAAGRSGGAGAAGRAMTPTGTAGTGSGAAGMMSAAGRSSTAGTGAGAASMSMGGRMGGGAGGAAAGMGGAAGGGRGGAGAGGMGGAAAGMGGAAGGGNTNAATFTQVYGLIMAGCGCHITGSSGGLAMPNKNAAYMNLVGANSSACSGQKRVVANDPNTSVLVHAIDRTKIGNCTPPAMPAGGMAKWSQADIDKVKSWVMAGAMNN